MRISQWKGEHYCGARIVHVYVIKSNENVHDLITQYINIDYVNEDSNLMKTFQVYYIRLSFQLVSNEWHNY